MALGQIPTDMLWETLIQSEFFRTGDVFHAGFESWKTISRLGLGLPIENALELITNLPEKVAEAGRFQETMLLKSAFMRLAEISSGGLGMVPTGARIGDPIYLFYGLSVPIMLRGIIGKGDTKTLFTIVGGCYVQKLQISPEEVVSREEDITLE